MDLEPYTRAWQRDGYLVVPRFLQLDCVSRLRHISETAYKQWESDSHEDAEPGGYAFGPNAWVMLHLNHPRYHRGHPGGLANLLDTVASPFVQRLLAAIMHEPAVMMQCNLYIDPPGQTRIGNWHRDCQFYPENRDPERQRVAVEEEAHPPRELHMHIPLVPTMATEVVPGSHNRWDEDEEYRLRTTDPTSDAMPGRLQIELQPGDLAFFHTNSIHRGMYLHGVPRRTIAVTFGRPSHPRHPTAESMQKSRGYVATYQPWFADPDYLEGCDPETQAFYDRFVSVYRDSWDPTFLDGLKPPLQDYFQSR